MPAPPPTNTSRRSELTRRVNVPYGPVTESGSPADSVPSSSPENFPPG